MKHPLLSTLAVLGCWVTLPACGDDDEPSGGTQDSTSTGEDSTTTSSTTSSTSTSTTDASTTSSTTDASTTTDSAGGTTDPDTATDSATDGDTEGAGACDGLEMGDCESTENCGWVGNPNNGMCVDADPADCDGLDNMQACNANPACAWSNQGQACAPA